MSLVRASPPNSKQEQGLYPSSILILMLLVLLALSAGLGRRDPSPPDEPRFVLAARHMVETGDWLVPHRGREFYAEKPPVFMWMQAVAFRLYPDWSVAFLLPSVLAALGTLWLTYDLARRLWGRSIGVYAASALWVCIQFGLQAQRGQIDMVLVGMTTLSLWAMLRHLLLGPAWAWLWFGAFVAGFGTVTKGVGFLPLLVLLPWLGVRRFAVRPEATTSMVAWRWGLLPVAFLAGTLVWLGPLGFALVVGSDPALKAYAGEILLRQTAERYVAAWHHVQPVWYYAKVVAVLWLPGVLLLPWLVPRWWQQLRDRNVAQWLLLGWVILVFVFFSASPGKREVYIFPALPALCVAAAPLLPELLRQRGVRWALAIYVLMFAGILLALGASEFFGLSDWAHKHALDRDIGAADLRVVLLWLIAAGVTGITIVLWARLRHGGIATVLFSFVLWTTYGAGLMPALSASSSAKAVMNRVEQHLGPDAELGVIAWREQNLLQLERPAVDFGFRQPWQAQWNEAARWVAASPRGRWLFVLEDALSPCVDPAGVIAVGRSNRRQWVLVPGIAVAPGCRTPVLSGGSGAAL